jgi:hypothetical protein
MTQPHASITVAGRSLELPLESLHQIVGGAEPSTTEALFLRAEIRRRTALALRKADPTRYRDIRLGGGSYWLGIGQQHWQRRTLAEILVQAARWLHDDRPDALLRLSQKRKHSRAYIAQDPAALYAGRADLASFAKPFAPGWYVDTNLSAENTHRFLDDVFSEAGLAHRRDWYFARLSA